MCCFIWPNDTLNKQVLHPACLLHSYYLSTFFSIFAFIFSFLPTIGRYDKIIISHKRLSLSWSKPTTNEVKRKGEKRRREDQQQEGREEEGRAQYILHMDYVTKKTIIIMPNSNPKSGDIGVDFVATTTTRTPHQNLSEGGVLEGWNLTHRLHMGFWLSIGGKWYTRPMSQGE